MRTTPRALAIAANPITVALEGNRTELRRRDPPGVLIARTPVWGKVSHKVKTKCSV